IETGPHALGHIMTNPTKPHTAPSEKETCVCFEDSEQQPGLPVYRGRFTDQAMSCHVSLKQFNRWLVSPDTTVHSSLQAVEMSQP
ncbi:hypothetical protein J6590_104075, partial [Homalodisca vitripennis]